MTDQMPAVKPWRFSATAAETYSQCPLAWSYRYEMGMEGVPTRPLRIGRLMAMTVERYLTHCYEQQVETDVSAIDDIARKTFATEGAGLGLDALDEVLKVGSFFVQSYALDFERLVGVEVWLPPKGVEPVTFAGREVVGKVDALLMDDEGQRAIVQDQKTNWAIWSERETRSKLQARLYPILVLASFPDVQEVEVTFQFIRWGVERTVVWSRAEIEEERKNLEALSQLMQKPGARPATPGDRCSYCEYVSICPVFKTARTSGVFVIPTNDEEAEKVIETLLVLDAGVKQRKDALRAYTSGHGPIELNGIRVGHFTRETPVVDPHAFAAWCGEDIDPLDYLRLGSTELKRLVRKRKSLAELIRPEVETRFAVKRSTENEEEEVA